MGQIAEEVEQIMRTAHDNGEPMYQIIGRVKRYIDGITEIPAPELYRPGTPTEQVDVYTPEELSPAEANRIQHRDAKRVTNMVVDGAGVKKIAPAVAAKRKPGRPKKS